MIIRGSNPTHTFTLPVDANLCAKLRALYAQDGKTVLKIENDRFTRSDTENKVSCTLTQRETLMFDCTKHCDVQLRILTTGGDSLVSVVEKVTVGRCLDNEVLE